MSETIILNHEAWETYVEECRGTDTKPTISDFLVWLADSGLRLNER